MRNNAKKHPSYGKISIVRAMNSGGKVLFGSSITHNNTIVLTISPADISREYHKDWILESGDPDFIQVEMSMAQWANMVSSIGIGSGTPCTVVRVGGTMIEAEKESPKKTALFIKEFRQRLKGLTENDVAGPIQELKTLIDGLNVSQKAKTELEKAVNYLVNELRENLPFVAKQFADYAEQTTTEILAEQEAAAINMLVGMGVEAFKEKNAGIGFQSQHESLILPPGEKEDE